MSFTTERVSSGKVKCEVICPLHEVDSFKGAEIKEYIQASAEGVDAVIMDFSKVAYLNSSGLRELIQILKILRRFDRPLRLIHLSHDTKMIFQYTNLDRLFIFFDSLDEAMDDLNGEN